VESVPEGADTVLVRYGEIGVKSSKVRRMMEDVLRTNVERAVERRGVEADVGRWWSRVLVGVDGGERAVGEATDAASGGIDSPVAAWRAMRRGCPATLVYIDLGAYGGADHVARAYETAETLARYAPDGLELWHVSGEEAVEKLLEETDDTRMLSYRSSCSVPPKRSRRRPTASAS